MSIKDLFGKRSNQIVTQADVDKLEKDIESTEYAEAKITDDMRFVPKVTVNFDDPKTFARYGSAEKYYEDAIYSILNTYPYDGSKKEKQEWHNKSTYIDNWIFDNKYPRTTGYVSLNTSNAFTTPAAHTDTFKYRTFTNPQYVTIKGGPHPTPDNPDGKLSKEYPFWQGKSNLHDSAKTRETNLHVDGATGNTIEFWWKKESISESGIESLFYLTNGIDIGTANWARMMIEHDDPSSATSFFYLSYMQDNGSSTNVGIQRKGIGASADFPSGFDATKWNHYAFTFKNASANITHTDIKLYLNGKLISSDTQIGSNSKQISTFNWGTGMKASIGAYLDDPISGSYSAMLGLGATRSKFDEFRFWKKTRTAEEIGRNWFTQIDGGTNTDDSNVDLGVYYKFNEGIINTITASQADAVALDSSGRISNGSIVNYNLDVRSTGSAIDESGANNTEFKDPILYSIHPSVSTLLEDMKLEGNSHDITNNSSIYHTLPEWITSSDEDADRKDLSNLTQVLANYFDTLHLQIEALPTLKNTNYVSGDEKPLPFANKLLESVGFLAPEMFIDATVLESFLKRNEERVFEEDIVNIKNLIYQNIYNNISNIYKSKGTEKSFRNLLRCFGIGDQLVKINLYGDNVSFKLQDNYKSISVKKNYLDFNDPDRHIASCYQQSVGGNANSTSFISGSITSQFDYVPFTLETEVIFPRKAEIDSPAFFDVDFTTSSLFGMHEANPANAADLTWHGTDECGFKVQAIKSSLNGKEAKFKLETTAAFGGGTAITLESDIFKDVYDNQKWNFAVSLKPDKYPTDLAAGTTDTTYTLEFYGVSMLLDIVQEEFTKTIAVPAADAKAALNAAKRVFVGAEHTDYGASAADKCDAKISGVRYWLDYLDNDTIKDHSRDATNYGSKNPSKPAYLQTSINQYNLLQADTLALHWDFETATVPAGGAGGLNSDSFMFVEDVTSGSLQMASDNFIYSALKYQHTGKADFYLIGDKKAIDRNYIFTAKQQLPEVISSSDTVNILTQDDITFTKESRPIDYFWAIEKSMYQAVSDEMINIFASISDFNNLIGNPVNRYRMEYKELGKLREMFFDKVSERPNIEKYVEFYKWIDSSVNAMLQELVPASANFSDEMRTMIESHILERNKYWNKLPTLEMNAKIPESSALGINEMLYNWQNGHATVTEGENALWWKDRAERDNSVITSGTTAVDDDKDNILNVATTHVTGSWMDRDLKSSGGSYKASTYVLRNLARPYKFSAEREIETEDIIYPISITNIPSPPSDPAPFKEQHDGTFVENPTSVSVKEMGNYRFPYDVVQTSGRKNNNSWFNTNGGLGSSILTSSESETVYGHYDFVLPDRTPKKHIFVERFSAPGAPATMQTGMLDVEGEEYSVYNSLNFRNLDVRLRLGEWLTKHFEWDDADKSSNPPSTPAPIPGGPRENFHKLHRNVKHLYQSDGTCTSNYDNFWIQHQIPQSGYQYSWIKSSVQSGTGSLQVQSCPQGFATDYENLAPQYPTIETDPSSANYGLSVGATNDSGFPFLNAFRSWDKEKHANTYELVRTIDQDEEEVVKGNCPVYWSGSNIIGDDILSNTIWDKYESGSLTFNELMLHRNGPYQYPSWKQIRNAENPAVVAMRKSNIYSVLDKPSTIYFTEGVGTSSFTQTRSGNTVNYIEPAVSWNKPMIHTVVPSGSNTTADLTSTYNNNLEAFANPYLSTRLEFEKSAKQMYDIIKDEYIPNKGNFTLKELRYSEYIFPKHNNSALGRTRSRSNYAESSGKTTNGYDRNSAIIKTFWKDKPLDRQRTVYSHEDYLNTAENALGARVRNSSVWALDYFKYMTVGEDCTRYTGTTTVDSSSYVATMRGDLAWAGFAQHRGFIYEGTSIDVNSNDGNGRPAEDAKLILPPRPTLQFIHNPNSQKAKEEGWAWKAGEISNNTPWNDSYIDYSQDIKLMSQNYSILPEFKISDHIDFYVKNNGGNFRVINGNILDISGVDKIVATSSYYFSNDGENEIERVTSYSLEENKASGYERLSRGYMHNTSVRDINNICIQEPSTDIESLSAWKSMEEYPIVHLNKNTVSDFLTTDKQNIMISKNSDQWMSTDLDFDFVPSEFKLGATKTAWNDSTNPRGIPVGFSPTTTTSQSGISGLWRTITNPKTDYEWDRWENTLLLSFWVNLDKDGLTTRKANSESIGCISLHDNKITKIPSDYFGLDDAALYAAHNIDTVAGLSAGETQTNKTLIEESKKHTNLSFEDNTRDNKRKIENLKTALKDFELYPSLGSEQSSFYLSDASDEKGRACWVDTVGNKVYFNISPYYNLTDESKLPDLTPGQWNHISILYLGGSSTDDSTNMGFDARHHRVFLWVNNKLIPSEVPSTLTTAYDAISSQHPTNGTLHQYISRVNTKKISAFGGIKGSLTFGKCDPVRSLKTSAFGYEMKSAILPGKVSDFVLIRGGEIGLIQNKETQSTFPPTQDPVKYQKSDATSPEKWDWLFNNELAFSTLSTMESSLIKDLYQNQSIDINTIVDNWKTNNITYTTAVTISQSDTAGSISGSTDKHNETKATTTSTANTPVLSGYWKMGFLSWEEKITSNPFVDQDFLDCYSHTDNIDYLNKIINDHLSTKSVPTLRLEVDAVKKLIPYNGFYPSQRAVQLGNLYYDSVAPYVTGDNDTDPWSRARTEQALLQPLFAPGILFNSIKAGIAVDWAAYTGEYDSNRIDLRDKYLGNFNLITPDTEEDPNNIKELTNTVVDRVILETALGALSSEVQLGQVSQSKISEMLPRFVEKARTNISREAQRMYKSATIRATTEDFEKWADANNRDVAVKTTLREFNRTQTRDLKWTPAATPSIEVSANMSSILGKDTTTAIKSNPAMAQSLAQNIVNSVGNFSIGNIMYGARGQIGMRSPMADVSELDLEGTYLDKEPNVRIPFEALVSLSGHLPEAPEGVDDKKVFYLAPSYYLERTETGNWDADDPTLDRNLYNNLRYPYFEWSGKSDALYEMAMHNFLAEIPNFFLRDGKLTTFLSTTEDKFKSVEEGTTYYMDVDLYKSSDDFKTTISPHDGTLAKIYNNNTNNQKELVDKDGNSYTTHGRYYGPALRCKSKGKCRDDGFYIEDPAQAPYTPSYFYGKAKARLAYRPSISGYPTLEDIHKNTTIQYINDELEKKFASKTSPSGSLTNYRDTPAYRGRMPIESSLNLFGKTKDPESEKYAWSISTKFESPALNFNSGSNRGVRYYGFDRRRERDISLDIGENPCSTVDSRNLYGAVDRDPRGVGMWSGYGKPDAAGLFLELVKPSQSQQKHSTVDSDVDTNPYIIQLAIKTNVTSLHDSRIILRDPYGNENEITIGQPLKDVLNIKPAKVANLQTSRLFNVLVTHPLYSKNAKIRTIYTALESTEDNPLLGMSNNYNIEAFFNRTTSQPLDAEDSKFTPKPFDVANAICYHINYRYNKESSFNWIAKVKWVQDLDRALRQGASRVFNLEKSELFDPSFNTNGAIVELEWRPNYKAFRDATWRLNNPKKYNVPSAKVEYISKLDMVSAMRFYKRSNLADINSSGQTSSNNFDQIKGSGWAAFYSKSILEEKKKTGSLAEICGFNPEKSRVGDVANSKIISEAVVMIPFTKTLTADTVRIGPGDFKDADNNPITNKNFFRISKHLISPSEGTQVGSSITNMIGKMKKYNIPPLYDFIKYTNIIPFVMYIFEFEEELDRDDLSNIWQGLMPECARKATKYDLEHPENKQVIEHKLDKHNFFEGKKLPEDVQWMTFKVKKKANIDYYKLTADSIDDQSFKFKVENNNALKPDYSYNWPYDHFSLVEMARISGGVSIIPSDLKTQEEDEE